MERQLPGPAGVCGRSIVLCALLALGLGGCKRPSHDAGLPQVSRSLALDGESLWVVNPESDSIARIDVGRRALEQEISLAPEPPRVDPATGRYEPRVRPRAIALVPRRARAYVAGQSANRVFVVDTRSGQVLKSIPTGAEPTAVVARADGSAVYVVNHQSATVQKIDGRTDTVVATAHVGEHPWGASLRADGAELYVSHLLRNPGVTVLRADDLAPLAFTPLPEEPAAPGRDKRIPNGEARGVFSVVPRPGQGALWVPHMLLATGTPQPELDFESTVFPTVTRLAPGGRQVESRLLFRPSALLTATGSFSDSVSGPRDVAFTPDGRLALVAMAQSEDVMVFDAATGYEAALVRPIPSALLEGIIVDGAGARAYVHGRSTHNVSVLSVGRKDGSPRVAVDGPAIETVREDPMPAPLRKGMRLFYSSNSAAFPITRNFWVACASCHLEGQTDAVTWRFTQGPRDTPSNAGGPMHTGFLFRQATRTDLTEYDQTIRVEQGGAYDRKNPKHRADLQALADFTNKAIPFPQNPRRLEAAPLTPSETRGKALFARACVSCHSGDYFTDSGSGNPSLDLDGPVVLHDVGTCVTRGPFPDQRMTDVHGNARAPCLFDTPTLRGVFATAPYFHDGSAATLDDVLVMHPPGSRWGAAEIADLSAYLKTL